LLRNGARSEAGCDLNFEWSDLIEIEERIDMESMGRRVPDQPASNPFAKGSCESGGETFVAMMQATDLRYSNHSSDLGWLNRARDRAILVERKMGASSMVVVDV
jgi:hypothetical protein